MEMAPSHEGALFYTDLELGLCQILGLPNLTTAEPVPQKTMSAKGSIVTTLVLIFSGTR